MIEMFVDYGNCHQTKRGVIACVVNSDRGISTYTKEINLVESHNGELAAVLFAMRLARSKFTHERVNILTDQMCIVRAVREGKKLKYKGAAKHQDLKARLDGFNKLYSKNKEQFVFSKVKSHAKCLGHNYADIIAGVELTPTKAKKKKLTNIENKIQKAVTKANPPKEQFDIYNFITMKLGELLCAF